MAKANADKGFFVKVDIEENEAIAEEYKVEAMPSVHLVKNGEFQGMMQGSKLENFKKFISDNI
eukprot:CAMPEP_0202957122 /NCGR_PEP_ID=MMETSP1396-20130829/1563_1 /ASSEMBLY_ACC=CAM_ASM_000872 /TAXON_ID= /ORGANISM="Pseudokeronopsis sp., Strain Brazil" /LENGTH=62 /DNA_ID=CAMNT_0049674453 /DNA_START=138 /DNA_END=326 /DNA_ORIENTATION=-